jgi:uncharacterized protein (TIGR02452 family)
VENPSSEKKDSLKPVIEVSTSDTFTMAEKYVSEGLNPLVLNFASDFCPGGGVKKGSRAQEEDLFRRSNYFQSLNTEKVKYPIDGCIVYSPDVYIVREFESYRWKPTPIKVSCVAAAASRRPRIHLDSERRESFADDRVRFATLRTIHEIFNVALLRGHDSLVLGAWGCGAFRGPRDEMAQLFAEVIQEKGHLFRKIGFGILVRNETDNENYYIFSEILSSLKFRVE